MIWKVFPADSLCLHGKPDKEKAIFLLDIFLWSFMCDTIKSVLKSSISDDNMLVIVSNLRIF